MPSIVNIDENNICNIVVQNFAPYDSWEGILGIMETEEDELVPLMDDFFSSVGQDIHNRFPKVKRKILSREEINYKYRRNSKNDTLTYCAKTRMPLA